MVKIFPLLQNSMLLGTDAMITNNIIVKLTFSFEDQTNCDELFEFMKDILIEFCSRGKILTILPRGEFLLLERVQEDWSQRLCPDIRAANRQNQKKGTKTRRKGTSWNYLVPKPIWKLNLLQRLNLSCFFSVLRFTNAHILCIPERHCALSTGDQFTGLR